jgi:uncharacterized integral membrane protein
MRLVRNTFVAICVAVILVVLAIFAVQNIRSTPVRFIGYSFPLDIWWISTGSALLGFLLAILLIGPGRIAAAWRTRRLTRERAERDRQLVTLQQEHETLRAQHAHLQAEREGLQVERDQLRARLDTRAATPRAFDDATEPLPPLEAAREFGQPDRMERHDGGPTQRTEDSPSLPAV